MSKIQSWKDIPYSEKANNFLTNLDDGVAVAVRMRHVHSSDPNQPEKVQVEFAEKTGTAPTNMLAVLNSDDTRFSSGARRAWLTASKGIAEKMFGVIPEGEASVEILSPLKAENGKIGRLLITEFPESELTESEKDYPENYLKRAGAEGNYFYAPDGQRVCSRTSIIMLPVGQNPAHILLEGAYGTGETVQQTLTGSKPALHGDVAGA